MKGEFQSHSRRMSTFVVLSAVVVKIMIARAARFWTAAA